MSMIHFDKRGRLFEVRSYRHEDCSHLEQMYDKFSPKGKYQGIPPSERAVCRKWIKGLIEAGENLLAWQEAKVIGHVVVLPDFERDDAEYLIFVLQYHRGLGVGKALSEEVFHRAGILGLKTIWLTVEPYNFRATGLYKKLGFQFIEESSVPERMMILQLQGEKWHSK
jgi:GNAT superfamily N-acetyltransferase